MLEIVVFSTKNLIISNSVSFQNICMVLAKLFSIIIYFLLILFESVENRLFCHQTRRVTVFLRHTVAVATTGSAMCELILW